MALPFFGQVLALDLQVQPATQRSSAGAVQVLHDDDEEIAPLAAQLDRIRTAHELDDYGTLRLAIASVDSLGIRTLGGGRLLTITGALERGEWSPLARLLAIGALLRRLGYNVVPHQLSRTEGALGLPIGDPLDALDVTRQGMTRTIREGRKQTKEELHWTFWDGVGALGQARPGSKPVLEPKDLFEGPRGTMRFLQRRVPAWTRLRVQADVMPVEGLRQGIAYQLRPDLADYLELLPQQPFHLQTHAAALELEELGIAEALAELARVVPDEGERIDALLRALQRHFEYRIGPLRSLHVIFRDRHGDCDQLSVLMAAALHHLGYQEDDLRTMRWKSHLCLAVRPRSGRLPEGAVTFQVPGAGAFAALDSTYYVRRNGEPITRWGQLDQKWARQRFKVGRVHFGG